MAEKLEIEITASSKQAVAAINEVGDAARRQGRGVGKFTKTASTGFRTVGRSAKIAGAAILASAIAIGTKAVKAAVGFGRAMAEVSTITDDTAEENAVLTENVKAMAISMGVNARQTALALYQTISAGVTDSREAMDLLIVATNASIGGLTSQEIAVDALTTVLNSYGLSTTEAADVSDILFTTVRLGKIRFSELASTIGRVTPIASSAGISFEEVGSAIAALTKTGLSAELATTALRATITSLIQPTSQMKVVADKLGLELGLQAVQGKGLSGILDILTKLYNENNETVTKLFPNVRALTGVLSLVSDNSREFSSAMEEMANRMGAADAATLKMNASMSRQLERSTARLNVSMIDLGNTLTPGTTGAMEAVAEQVGVLSDGTKDFSENADAMRTSVKAITTDIILLGKVLFLPLTLLFKLGKLLSPISPAGIGAAVLGRIAAQTEGGRAFLGVAPSGGLAASVGAGGRGAFTEEQITAARETRGMTTVMTGPVHIDARDPRDNLLEPDAWRDEVQGARMR